jgi:signal transduction histidine kinase
LRAAAEKSLLQSDNLSRLVLQNIHDGVLFIQGTQTLLANQAAAFIVKDSIENVLQQDFLSFVIPDERNRVADCFRYCQEYGRNATLDRVQISSPEGKPEVIIALQVTQVSYADQPALLVTLRDVTFHTHAEETIKAEAEIAAALARVGQALIGLLETPVILDQLCRLVTEILGCDCSYTILWDEQKNLVETIVGYGDLPEQEEAVRTLLFSTPAIIDELARNRDGKIIEDVSVDECPTVHTLLSRVGIESASFVVFRRGARTTGAFGVAYRHPHEFSVRQRRLMQGIAQLASFALTNARLLEDLEDANRLKEDFVGTMSHELRTPLHILYGYTELLRDESYGPLTSEQIEILGRMEKNVQELTSLINTTLDLSRLQSQRIPLSIQEAKVAEFLAELANEAQQMQKSANVTLQWSATPNLPSLWTDIAKLKIIVKNLLTNALKFTENGTVTVSVTPQDNGIMFSVSDTGPGISAEVLPAIFEPFRQGGTFATRKQGGVGLGLYIVQRLLDLLGGTITVESEVGKGSTFRVWLPTHAREK